MAATADETPQRERPAPPSVGRRILRWFKEAVIVVVSALVLSFIIKTFFFQSFWIPSASMEPTLDVGDRILVTKWRPGPMDLRRGDVVVFRDPDHWLGASEVTGPIGWWGEVLTFVGLMPGDAGIHLVKRVVGLPGDTVECRTEDGNVLVNGSPIVEPYVMPGVSPCGVAGAFQPWFVTVPADSLWVMGDNRNNSGDSRFHTGNPGGGSVPIANVVGTAFVTVWPMDHWHGIGNPLAAGLETTTGAPTV